MKKFTRTGLVLACLATCGPWPLPGCDDPGLHEALPQIDGFAVADSDSIPSPGAFQSIPSSGEIVVDFGRVDVGSINQRYLFIPNAGLGVLNLTNVSPGASPNPDFQLACSEPGGFVDDCPNPLAIDPGGNLIIEVTYIPGTAGIDSDQYSLELNTKDPRELTLLLAGQGVEPEIEVCISDCVGDQQKPACQQAEDLCNHMVDKDDLLLFFGDADMDQAVIRVVTVRNRGLRPLDLTSIDLASDTRYFTADLMGLVFPHQLSVESEVQIYVGYDPATGGEHVGQLEVASTDVSEPIVVVQLTGRGIAPRSCVEPRNLDFGNVVTNEVETRSFTVTSCGLVELELHDLILNPDSSDDFSITNPPGLPTTLAVGERLTVEVQYHPLESGPDTGSVDYYSNDLASEPDTGLTGSVRLTGDSMPLACDLQVTPVPADLGVAEIGQTAELELVLANTGNDTCNVQLIEIEVNSSEEEFAILLGGEPFEIEPAAAGSVTLGYSPVDRGQDLGVLLVMVNDIDGSQIRVDLQGFGIFPGGEGPVAVCSVEPVSAVSFETLTWYGDQSFDTNGHPITDYQWSIEAFPAGSAATLQGSGAIRTTEADQAGDYSARLTVVNDLGQVSEPCLATATVVPTEDLWIEMYWTHAGDDFDLHLLAPGGSPRTDGDCYYINCDEGAVLDWGVADYDGDDPGLDLDDIAGTGPENINIADPADGIYTVFVHDFPISAYQGANPVTVKVYIDGVLEASFEESISGENYEWYVCEIDWASRTVTPL